MPIMTIVVSGEDQKMDDIYKKNYKVIFIT